MEKRKLDSDRKLINVLIGIDPADWARRDNGELVYLNQAGQKFVLTPPEIEQLTDKKLVEKEKAQAKPATSPEQTDKSRSHHKKAEVKELTEEQAPYEANPD
jgi:hypothetical protein